MAKRERQTNALGALLLENARLAADHARGAATPAREAVLIVLDSPDDAPDAARLPEAARAAIASGARIDLAVRTGDGPPAPIDGQRADTLAAQLRAVLAVRAQAKHGGSAPNGELAIQSIARNAERMARIAAGIEMYAALTSPAFSQAIDRLARSIADIAAQTSADVESVQSAIEAVAKISGRITNLERIGPTIHVTTPDETVAAALAAASLPPGADPTSSEGRVSVVADGYLVVIAA